MHRWLVIAVVLASCKGNDKAPAPERDDKAPAPETEDQDPARIDDDRNAFWDCGCGCCGTPTNDDVQCTTKEAIAEMVAAQGALMESGRCANVGCRRGGTYYMVCDGKTPRPPRSIKLPAPGQILLSQNLPATAVAPDSIPYINLSPAKSTHGWKAGDRLEIAGERFVIRCVQNAITARCKNPVSGKEFSPGGDTVLLDRWPATPREQGTEVRLVKP